MYRKIKVCSYNWILITLGRKQGMKYTIAQTDIETIALNEKPYTKGHV